MDYGARTGRIVTTQPAHRDIEARIVERSRGTRQNGDEDEGVVPREKSFYVYHRQTLPCRLCRTTVRSQQLRSEERRVGKEGREGQARDEVRTEIDEIYGP